MKFRAQSPKITVSNLTRLAVIYVRQSSARQVIENTASAAFQRSLADLARHYGWPDSLIVVDDRDQGRSGTSTIGREGFKWLRQQIFEEQVGAIICWDASRIARDSAALAQLIKLCAATNTLIIDEKGIYDPNNDNDRIFLGLINVIVDAEGRRIAEKFIATKRSMAEAGKLRIHLPIGYVYDDDDKIVMDPDEEIQASIRKLFSQYDESPSIRQAAKSYNLNGNKFPTRKTGKGKNRRVIWRELSRNRALCVFRNPIYAGTYAYAQTKTVSQMLSADATEQSKKKRKNIDGVILIQGAHEGYISWEKYKENQKRLEANRYLFYRGSTGAPRNGAALLQGIIQCEVCGKNMYSHYQVIKGKKKHPGYICNSDSKAYGSKICNYISGGHLDKAVKAVVLEALNPAQVRMALKALEEGERDTKATQQQQLEALRHARADVKQAELKYDSIDPTNTLVAKLYENKLQELLDVVMQLEAEQARVARGSSRRLSDAIRQKLLGIGKQVREVWDCDAVTYSERKSVIRCLIKKVIVGKSAKDHCYNVDVHWMTGAIMPLGVQGRRYIQHKAVELMCKLAPDHTITEIVERLNQAGFTPPRAERFTYKIVRGALRANGITHIFPEMPKGIDGPRGDGRLPTSAIAKMLNVSVETVVRWCEQGILDSVRSTPRGPRWIKISSEQILALRKTSQLRGKTKKVREGGS
jgi:DNA invertase Pin-like site-specific DNA recombinase